MSEKNNTKSGPSGAGSVQYRSAKKWQIVCISCAEMVQMCFYFLIGLASYSANIGFGIASLALGGILTFTRIFDAITDPLLAFVYDKVNTRFGKVRILMVSGYLVMCLATLFMFNWAAGKGHGVVVFVLLYVVYIIGYTLFNMTGKTLSSLLTNDPKQRPFVGACMTVFSYGIPMVMNIVAYQILMPKYGSFTAEFLSTICWVVLAVALVGVIVTCFGITERDRPESFVGVSAKHEKMKVKDMLDVLMHNRPLQCFIASGASDKIAQQVASQSIIVTMLNGIIIGDMTVASRITTIAIGVSIVFAFVGAGIGRKLGNKKTIVIGNWLCLGVTTVMIAFLIILYMGGNTQKIATSFPIMLVYLILYLLTNGTKMLITNGNNGFMSDVIDYELDRGGKYIPAVVSGVYSLVDKLVSSLGGLIATASIALIGYTQTLPQPGDPLTPGVFWMTLALMFGLPIIGWIITLISMRLCKLDKDDMAEIQKRIAEKKAAAKAAEAA